MRIKVANFLGSFPHIHNTKLKDTAAEKAINVDVTSGVLRPFYSVRLPKGKTATLNVPPSTLYAVVYLYPENQE